MNIRLFLAISFTFAFAVLTQGHIQESLEVEPIDSNKVKTRFDKEKNETVVYTVSIMAFSASELENIDFIASYKYKGEEFVAPDHIELNLKIEPTLNEPYIIIWADGLLHHSDQLLGFGFISGGRDRTVASMLVPLESFHRIAQAEKVEIELMRQRFELKMRHIGILRELSREIKSKETK